MHANRPSRAFTWGTESGLWPWCPSQATTRKKVEEGGGLCLQEVLALENLKVFFKKSWPSRSHGTREPQSVPQQTQFSGTICELFTVCRFNYSYSLLLTISMYVVVQEYCYSFIGRYIISLFLLILILNISQFYNESYVLILWREW